MSYLLSDTKIEVPVLDRNGAKCLIHVADIKHVIQHEWGHVVIWFHGSPSYICVVADYETLKADVLHPRRRDDFKRLATRMNVKRASIALWFKSVWFNLNEQL